MKMVYFESFLYACATVWHPLASSKCWATFRSGQHVGGRVRMSWQHVSGFSRSGGVFLEAPSLVLICAACLCFAHPDRWLSHMCVWCVCVVCVCGVCVCEWCACVGECRNIYAWQLLNVVRRLALRPQNESNPRFLAVHSKRKHISLNIFQATDKILNNT